MKSIAEIRTEILNAVFSERDRSIEGVAERALDAGIVFERERIKAILEKSAPPGLERAQVAFALSPNSTVEGFADFIAGFPLPAQHHATLRKAIRIVPKQEVIPEESAHAG